MTIPLISPAPPAARDTLQTLRAYHALAPWSLRDLAALSGTLLEASGVVPVNVAARARPTERTIRFYVMKCLVDPPEGRGTAAVYRYRHLLQVLGIKLRQMDGASLDALAREFSGVTGDVLERRVATALGPGVPSPDELGALEGILPARGRSARALRPRMADAPAATQVRSTLVRRIVILPGAELVLEAGHPLFRQVGSEETIARVVAQALESLAEELSLSR
ncbi:MAG TPA: MerR family transcriptional regulator [Gemmatimonadales bacterium]